MPSFRRFLAHTLPGCFGSAEDTISLHGEAHKPRDATSQGKKGDKKKSTLPDSLFATTIIKTVDTRVASTKAEEDELHLVEMGTNNTATEINMSSSETRSDTKNSYRSKHNAALPHEW